MKENTKVIEPRYKAGDIVWAKSNIWGGRTFKKGSTGLVLYSYQSRTDYIGDKYAYSVFFFKENKACSPYERQITNDYEEIKGNQK